MAGILAIDDSVEFLKMFKEILEELKCTVFIASSGVEGIKKLTEVKPDVIFLDYKMPQMNGIETLARIRKINKDVAVVILTGYAEMDMAVKAHYLNIFEFITKPFSIEDIKNVIERALKNRKKKTTKMDPASNAG